MKKWLKKVFEQILPTISYIKANRTLKEKIENPDCQSNSSYKANFDQISIDSFRQKYLEAFDTKNKFEDKAKTNVIGITIAITLITAVMSRVMRKIDFGIWQKSITGGGLTAPWLLFSRQGAKGQGRRYAARLALDAL